MNNEEKILSALTALTDGVAEINVRLGGMEQRLDGMEQRLDGVEQRLDRIEEDIVEIKEDAAITRGAVNQLLTWADCIGTVENIPVATFP